MKAIAQQLQLFSMLLGAPQVDSLDLLYALRRQHPWLQSPIDELEAISLQHWQGEHTMLFVNGYPRTVAPPFLSALRSGQMGGAEEEAMRDFYRQLGLEVNAMPADYLGTTFECGAWLLLQEARRDDEFEVLWNQHLYPAIADFARRLIEHPGLRLYQQMGMQLSLMIRQLSQCQAMV